MKRILYISSNDPEYFNGGAIGTKKFVECFKNLEQKKKAKIYYFTSKEENKLVNTTEKIEKKRTKIKAIISRALGLADQLGLYEKQILNSIKENKIDIVIFQSSRLGNLSEKIKRKIPNIKILQNFDNFEYKFSEMYTKNMIGILKKIELYNIKKIEKKALLNSDYNIFLTKKDFDEIIKFYKVNVIGEVIPLIYSQPKISFLESEKNTAIFTGSLDMQANIEAALFLINNIDKIKRKTNIKKLIIAGRNPNFKIIEKTKKRKDIEIYKNPSNKLMTQLIEKSTLYISPVFLGSGMKTKFLEAISHGIPIVASNHTLIGYDFFEKDKYLFIQSFRDFSLDDMIEKIKKIEKIKFERIEILNFYKENFDEKVIVEKIEEILLEKL